MNLNETEQKLLNLMNKAAVDENKHLKSAAGVLRDIIDRLVAETAAERVNRTTYQNERRVMQDKLAALQAQLDASHGGMVDAEEVASLIDHLAKHGEFPPLFSTTPAIRDGLIALLERHSIQHDLQVEREARDAMQEERDELVRLTGAEWRDDADGNGCWHFPVYDASGNVLAMLPPDEWTDTRKSCALQIQMLQDNQDINEFIVRGETENALLHCIRAALEHVEAGRETHARDVLRKLARKARQAPVNPEAPTTKVAKEAE